MTNSTPSISKLQIAELELVFFLPENMDGATFIQICAEYLGAEGEAVAQKQKQQVGDRYRDVYLAFERKREHGEDAARLAAQHEPLPICKIQLGPHQSKDAALRMRFAPSELSKWGLFDVQELLRGLLLSHYNQLMSAACVTTFRIQFYIEGITLDRLIIAAKGKRACTIVSNGDGRVHEITFGALESDDQLVFRDESQTDPELPRVSCEYRHQKKPLPFAALATSPNPFSAVTVCAVTDGEAVRVSAHFSHFLDSCRVRGPWSALMLITKPSRRRKYQRLLAKKLAVNWWRPDDVWAQIPAALQKLGLLYFLRAN